MAANVYNEGKQNYFFIGIVAHPSTIVIYLHVCEQKPQVELSNSTFQAVFFQSFQKRVNDDQINSQSNYNPGRLSSQKRWNSRT